MFIFRYLLLLMITIALTGSTLFAGWKAKQIGEVTGLDIPECALFDEARNQIFISNIETSKKEFWVDDGKGFISLLTPDFKMASLRLVNSTPDNIINAPKGMSAVNDYIYFNDNRRVMRASISNPAMVERVVGTTFGAVNDMVAYDGQIWVSDGKAGVVFGIDPAKGVKTVVKAPAGVNGITFFRGEMFAVSWALHDVFELDASGVKGPVAFGLASNFTNLDGIEILDDGTFIISDFKGNKVTTITPDRKTVETIIEITTPADMGLNRSKNILYVPSFRGNKAVAYQLYQD